MTTTIRPDTIDATADTVGRPTGGSTIRFAPSPAGISLDGIAPAEAAPVAGSSPAGTATRVAYVMSRFPKLSETFIVNEILAVEAAGARVSIHPLIRHREAVVQPDAARLAARAHFVPIAAPAAAGALVRTAIRRPLALLGCVWALLADSWRRPSRVLRSLLLLPVITAQAERIAALGVDHVHCHFATYPAFAGFVIRRLTGIPYSFTAHAHDIHGDQAMLARKVREASFVVAISEDNRRRLERAVAGRAVGDDGAGGATSIVVIHCGVDTVRFAPPRTRPAQRSGGRLEILAIGRLVPFKGHATLLEACSRLRDEGLPFRCTIVGEGPLEGDLRTRIHAAGLDAAVTLAGPRTSDEVLDLLHQSDVLALPSVIDRGGRMEGIPVVLMEAMSAGVPVVASRMTGIPELVVDGRTGLLVEPGDAAGLAAALTRLGRDEALRRRLSVAGRARIRAEFDLARQGDLLAARFAAAAAAARLAAGGAGTRATAGRAA